MAEIKQFRVHELKLEGDEGDVLVAFAQLDAVDSDADYTFPGAIPEGKSVPISAYSHATWPQRGGLLPVGKAVLGEAGGWAVAKGKFFTDTTMGRDHYLTVKHMGDDQQWSYGYDVVATGQVPNGVKAKRGLKTLDVHEISPVLLGAQRTAHTMAIKGEDKSYVASVSDATYALGTILRLAQQEAQRAAAGTAEDSSDAETLRAIAGSLTEYIRSTGAEVGSEEDLAELAAEAAASARMYSDRSASADLKDGPLAGSTFAEMSTRVLGDVNAFIRRAASINAIRLKEGRAISKARLELLSGHITSLAAAQVAIQEMIDAATAKTAESEDEDGAAKARALHARALLGAAHLELTSARTDH